MEGKDGRTEKATGKRRKESRDKGQVARSHDLSSAVGLAVGCGVLFIFAPSLLSQLEDMLARSLSQSGDGPTAVTTSTLGPLIESSLESFALVVAPMLLAAAIAGVAVNIAQVGFHWSSQSLRPKFTMLNPRAGLRRLFGPTGLIETGKALVKLSLIGGIAFLGLWSQLPHLGSMVGLPPDQILSEIGNHIEMMVLEVLPALVILALADLVWQRRRLAKSLMMTKQEVKQEARQTDVAPEVRSALRKRQYQQARRRMLAEVPTADVVIVNPTHFAVALRYDGALPAPELVAKGADHVAAAIRATADEHGVPIVENPPLARTLFREVELGAMIPEALFIAVAEVLAYVFRTARGRRRRQQAAATPRPKPKPKPRQRPATTG